MTNFKTPLRGQQELTLLGSEKTTSSLVVFIRMLFSYYRKGFVVRLFPPANFISLRLCEGDDRSGLAFQCIDCLR